LGLDQFIEPLEPLFLHHCFKYTVNIIYLYILTAAFDKMNRQVYSLMNLEFF